MRNLKMGDNLNNMLLYFNFPEDWYNSFSSSYEEVVLVETNKYQITAAAFGANYYIRLYNKEADDGINMYYDDDFEGKYHPENYQLSSDIGIVIYINAENNLNQYIQIDPEIRIIIDKKESNTPTKDKKTIVLKTEPLLSYENICDKLELVSDTNLSIKITRKLSKDESGNIIVLDTEIEEIFNSIEFLLFENDNYIYVEGTKFSNMYMEYLNTAKFNEVYSTKSEQASLISQLSDSVLIKVLEKLDGKEIVSLINVYPESIKILSSKIGIEGYTSINGNFIIDEEGTPHMKNGIVEGGVFKLIGGAELVTDKGLLTNLQFVGTGRKNSQKSVTGEFNELGFLANDTTELENNIQHELIFNAEIPNDFIVKSATIRMFHAPVNYSYEDEAGIHYFWGYSRNLKLYKTSNISNFYRKSSLFSSSEEIENFSYEEIPNAFGTSGFTASVPSDSSHQVQEIVSIDISSYLVSGKLNRIRIASSDSVPVYGGDEWYGNAKACAEKTGVCMAVLNVIGYKKFEEGV